MKSTDEQQLAEACAKALWDTDEATRALNMSLDHISPGQSVLSMRVAQHMCNGHGTCHGGYIFTLADSAFAFACNSYNQRTVAQHCTISYVAPALLNDLLTATAQEVSRQKRSGIYDVRITNQTQKTIAEFRGFSRTIAGQLLT